jgi:hypothetical protein
MTVVREHALGHALLELLQGAHDDDQPALVVTHEPPALVVLRADGTELSEVEEKEIWALLAADGAEPFESC